MMNKTETLKSAFEARIREIDEYQINIDNYTLAIAKVKADYADNPAIVDFGSKLKELLEQHKTEQLKAIIIRDVIADQLAELEAS